MNVIGFVSRQQLAEMQRRGLSPQQAVEAIRLETHRRFAGVHTVVVQPSMFRDGFDIVTL